MISTVDLHERIRRKCDRAPEQHHTSFALGLMRMRHDGAPGREVWEALRRSLELQPRGHSTHVPRFALCLTIGLAQAADASAQQQVVHDMRRLLGLHNKNRERTLRLHQLLEDVSDALLGKRVLWWPAHMQVTPLAAQAALALGLAGARDGRFAAFCTLMLPHLPFVDLPMLRLVAALPLAQDELDAILQQLVLRHCRWLVRQLMALTDGAASAELDNVLGTCTLHQRIGLALAEAQPVPTVEQLAYLMSKAPLQMNAITQVLAQLPQMDLVHNGNKAIAALLLCHRPDAGSMKMQEVYLNALLAQSQIDDDDRATLTHIAQSDDTKIRSICALILDPEHPATDHPSYPLVMSARVAGAFSNRARALRNSSMHRVCHALWLDSIVQVRLPALDRMVNCPTGVPVRFFFPNYSDSRFERLPYLRDKCNWYVLPEMPCFVLVPQHGLLLPINSEYEPNVRQVAVARRLELDELRAAAPSCDEVLRSMDEQTALRETVTRLRRDAKTVTESVLRFLLLERLRRSKSIAVQETYARMLLRNVGLFHAQAAQRQCEVLLNASLPTELRQAMALVASEMRGDQRPPAVLTGTLTDEQHALAMRIVECCAMLPQLPSETTAEDLVRQMLAQQSPFLQTEAVRLCEAMLKHGVLGKHVYIRYLSLFFDDILRWGMADAQLVRLVFAHGSDSALHQMHVKRLAGQVDTELLLAMVRRFTDQGRQLDDELDEFCLMLTNGELPFRNDERLLAMIEQAAERHSDHLPMAQMLARLRALNTRI